MRTSFFLALAYIVASVWAGGYQGCLERVLLFYAYQIDGLNDPKDQTLGFRCKKWDDKSNSCVNNDWVACKGKGGGRCNFNELMASLGKSRPTDKLVGPPGADQNTATPDIQETAKALYKQYTTPPNKKVTNFPPYKAMKGADSNFNDYTLKLGKVVNDAWRHKTDANKNLWDGFDASLEKINIARAGDHGPFLIKEVEAKLGKPNGMEIKLMNLGDNPISNPTTQWETVDWKATADAAKTKGIKDVDKLIRDVRTRWYTNDKSAGDHYAVFKTYKRIGDQARSCRK
ncbi:uncharacterized protein NFIA_106850 [Aspergillus fischeri NRRL 181]|uniref:Uncharacterized protein n=1 Tax=Neosartorya fischeri (strain ATCC 1020 / DSM 3700 / CBS 544.65 / FGSC A1164 / JCM 1740 / NRRL 181 / WB 181) TaxID=331117 RepID=A1CX44_NEOFI|nr:uncharacterized protein NFIA_106850 [Aspergillus fischeri NRRL 181]EAW25196.1 hypothetical protein NFIA_106850 [Aspergillus fischeri NRRL 181]KAG2027060.1 hypothetical protein GB937_000796 [Aspergillus fischeri]